MRTEFERGTEVACTAPNGTMFQAVVATGRVDRYGTLAVRRKADGRLVFADPARLENRAPTAEKSEVSAKSLILRDKISGK